MLSNWLKKRTGNIYIQMFRYFVSGGIAFVVDFLLLYLLTEKIGLHYIVSTIISFLAGLTITYLLSIYWVYDNRRFDNRKIELIIFILLGAVGLALTSFLMWLFTDIFHIYYMISKIFTTIVVSLWNFIAKKILLFPGKTRKTQYGKKHTKRYIEDSMK
ncbi:MAG: GtrA family protein [Paludibacteraceae bacterium]